MTEEFLTLAEIKELLTKEQKNRTLTTEQNYSLDHSTKFAKLSSKDAKKLVKELEKIEPLNSIQACKIVDIKERVTVDDETITKILDKVKEYS